MTDYFEDLIMAEARRQGYQPNSDAMRQAAIDLAGSSSTSQNLIAMPGKGSISPADFVRSWRGAMPESFSPISDRSASPDERRSGETLTAFMRRQLEAARQKPLPHDWDRIRAKATGLTARMMDEVASLRPRAQ